MFPEFDSYQEKNCQDLVAMQLTYINYILQKILSYFADMKYIVVLLTNYPFFISYGVDRREYDMAIHSSLYYSFFGVTSFLSSQ